jgi:hypothetical protein
VETLADKPSPKTMKIEVTAIRTNFRFSLPNSVTDSVKRVIGDDDTASFTAGATWFSQVQTPASTVPSALSMTTPVPANAATAQAITVTCTLTFNNALAAGEEFDCMLINNTSHAIIPGVNTIDATRKIVTVAHTSNLPAATNISMAYTVKDIYGQSLIGATSFATA